MLSGIKQPARASAAEHYSRLTVWLHGLLPRFLSWIPITWIGFAMIGLTGFGIDIGMLTLLHGGVHVPYPIAVTLSYTVASVANFILNRWLNFQVHGDIAKQSSKQLVVVVSNYLIWILGFSTVLDVIGVQYQVARIISACVEGLYLYLMMRLWVFRGSNSTAPLAPATDRAAVAGKTQQKSITR
ncbi:GtrA family protein [Microlunatus elymi]|uniref:GtrA family protein n=1 Tax=Microlunatus elymi TaxID=2596828 RepID=A0A516Q3Q0_9ACTN|nr:GtrA family protein [Microlunatus elymi]QDP98057.1 GtrA family protein [Microlunatus elymi]